MDDDAWAEATELAPLAPIEGPWAPGRTTVAKLIRHGDDLYLGMWCDFANPTTSTWYKNSFPPGPRDSVPNANEVVVLDLGLDPAQPGAVQIVANPSGAFSDTFRGDRTWDGDIQIATSLDHAGWYLEARLALPSVPEYRRGARLDLMRANVSRRTKSRTGGWAQTRRVELGWLTSARDGLAVEDLSAGLFGPLQERGGQVPLQVRVRNNTDRPRDAKVSVELLAAAGQVLRQETIPLALPAGQSVAAMRRVDSTGVTAARVRIDAGGDEPAFEARLPLPNVLDRTDCTDSPGLSAAVRPTWPIWMSDDAPSAYVMAVATGDKPVRRQGLLTLRDVTGKQVWQCQADVDLPAGGRDARLISIPAPAPGRYRLQWQLRKGRRIDQAPVVNIDYAPMSYLTELVGLSPEQLLQRLGCAPSNQPEDLALLMIKMVRLGEFLAAQRSDAKTDRTVEIQRLYWQALDLVEAMRTGRPFVTTQRGWFESVFRSPVDGSYQPVAIFVPYDYDKHPDRQYPLEVWLHGYSLLHLNRMPVSDLEVLRSERGRVVPDRIVMYPLGRGGGCGYGGVSGNDVRQAITAVKARYRVDPDRVHLGGESMGGFGTFEIGSQSPDLFASCTPAEGGGYWYDLEQMRNLPTFIHHGMADAMVSPFCSVSTAAKMQALDCPVQLYLYPKMIHEPLPMETTTPIRNLLMITRDSQPATVALKGRMLCFTHAYWAAIERFADPQQPGQVEAAFVSPNQLSIASRNVKWLSIALPCKWIDPGQPVRISSQDGFRRAQVTAGPAKAIYLRLDGERIEATTDRPAELDDQTAYTGGGSRRMFCEGRPVRLAYGSGGGAEAAAKAKALALSLARVTFNGREEFEVGGYPVLADTEVTDEILATCDLILLGSPADNALLARMADQLPVKIADGQVTVQANVPMRYRQDEVGFTLAWRNPLAKDRLIWWLGGFDSKEAVAHVAEAGEADLVVTERKGRFVLARAKVVGDWQLEQPSPPTPARTLWPTYAAYSQALAASLRTSLDADVAIWPNWDPPDDFGDQTLGYLRTARPEMHLVDLSGKDLREMHRDRLKRLTPATAPATAASSPASATSAPSSSPASAASATASAPSSQPSPQELADSQGGWAGTPGEQIRDEQTYRVLLIGETVWGLPNGGIRARVVRHISDDERDAALQRFWGGVIRPEEQASGRR
jgi:hypothetical protein